MTLRKISMALASVISLASVTAFTQYAAIVQDSFQPNTVISSRNTTKSTSPTAYQRNGVLGVSVESLPGNQLLHSEASTIMRILFFIGGAFTRKVSSLVNGNFLFYRSVEIQSESSFGYLVSCRE
jgi:hypothetical protein